MVHPDHLAAIVHDRPDIRDFLAALFEDAPVGFALFDTELRFVMVNATLAAINGVPAHEHVGRPLLDVLPEIEPSAIDALRRVLQTGRPLRYVEVRGRTPASPEYRTWLEDFFQVRTATGEVLGVAAVLADVTARRRSSEQATGLAALARRLNAASTVAEVADTIRAHTAEAIGGRHATLALRDDADPTIIRLLQSPSLPEHVARAYSSLPADSPNHIARAMRRGETVIVRDPLTLADVGGSLEEFEKLRKGRADAGVTVTAAAPLLSADGTVIGALASGWPLADDVDAELIARMQTVAELCAQAIDRARLADAQALAAQRSQALSALAQELASAVTVDEVWAAVHRGAPAVVGARTAAMGLIDVEGAAIVLRYRAGSGDEVVVGEIRKPLTDRRPHTDVVRTGSPVFVSSAADLEARYPGLAAEVGLGERLALAVVPLQDNTDRIVGTLSFTWDSAVHGDPLLQSSLDTLAELCGQTLERARLHAAEHELVEGLQRRLLRPMPSVSRLRTHAVHRAAQTVVGMGGDFHEGIVLPDDRLAVVLGDVAGHGMEAAADMAQLRTLLSTLLALWTPLDDLFARADAALTQIGSNSLATAVAAVIDPRQQTLSYVHAGHPPLVLRTPDGATAPLADARGGLLGVGIAAAPAATVPFGPGSVLVGYTDGLVEVRGIVLDTGIAALAEATAEAADAVGPSLDAAEIAARILARCVGDRHLDDDVALLVVSYPTSE